MQFNFYILTTSVTGIYCLSYVQEGKISFSGGMVKPKWTLRARLCPRQDDGSPSQVGLSVPSPHRSTEWRRKKKMNDVEVYEQTKEKDAARKREYRKKVKEDTSRAGRFKQKHQREMQAERQRRYRERKRASKISSSQEPTQELTTAEEPTASSAKDRREYYRKYRANKRGLMSRQKKQSVKAKDRERKRRPTPPSNTLQEETEMTSPEAYANFVEDLVEK